MNSYEDKIEIFLQPFEFEEMIFNIGEFSNLSNCTHVIPDIKNESLENRLNSCFDSDGWKFEIGEVFKIGKENSLTGILSVKSSEGGWITKSATEKFSKNIDLEAIEKCILRKCTEMLNVGGRIRDSYPTLYILGHIKELSKIHFDEIKEIHKHLLSGKNIPSSMKLGTGKSPGLNSFSLNTENKYLSEKQINYILSLAEKQGKKDIIIKEISVGNITKENFSEQAIKYGHNIIDDLHSISGTQENELENIVDLSKTKFNL